MTTRVFLMRHAETAEPGVFHGFESDVGLSERGYRQAEVIAKVMAKHSPEVVVSSKMLRAKETARCIAEYCGIRHDTEHDLHERKIGAYSRMSNSSQSFWPETTRRWMAGETSYAHEGAESFDDIRERVLGAWNRVVTAHEGRTIVIVAHGVVCKVLLLSILPGHGSEDWDRIGSVRNVAFSELVLKDAAWNALCLNELPQDVLGLETGGAW